MKKTKESCKLDINQSVPENILSRPEVKRKQCVLAVEFVEVLRGKFAEKHFC
jgi:hypothetical protein